jgi:hypothetical protein
MLKNLIPAVKSSLEVSPMLNMEFPHDPAIPLGGINLNN